MAITWDKLWQWVNLKPYNGKELLVVENTGGLLSNCQSAKIDTLSSTGHTVFCIYVLPPSQAWSLLIFFDVH